ncbi:K+-transporting ATPase ATPase B chain [Roseiarcus fermentans]|uniref:Potassium-transporting ATPase ATP-binding subunit n=1 Tax=Roseiarcus fermentans TaxID=1473586 RepID=A0A366F922_9HYPH|nr:potassium-transporting ATPase subunit KdpB [Roseiarcus fermentans]RBP10626.1 K+-transporting ATPase ATPase B chain [Roseiarcus fermentans]
MSSHKSKPQSLFDTRIIGVAAVDALRKLDPRALARNPVIFVTEVVSALVTVLFVRDLVVHNGQAAFSGQIAAWLWFTVLFANFAEAVAEGRGKAQADALRRTRTDTPARRYANPENLRGPLETVNALDLKLDDVVFVEAGEIIPGDGEILEGVASVNESAITGESAPVIREAGGDRSAVTGGTTVLSDWLKLRITAAPGSTFIDRMIALVEGAERQKTPNEMALSILLSGLTLIFLIVCVTLWPIARYSGTELSATVLIALLVCLIPTTIGGLLSAIGIAGMDRLIRFNVIATSGRAVEAAGDVDTLLLDKTGTITFGNRMATEFLPVAGVRVDDLAAAALASSLADETPEGRSIVALAKGDFGLPDPDLDPAETKVVRFAAQTRISGVDVGTRSVRKGAIDSILRYLKTSMDRTPHEFRQAVERVAMSGGTPLAVADNGRLLGVIHLKDIVKPGIKERFAALRAMGIRTVMVTGDNPVTAAAIASEAGVDDFLAEATPEDKLGYIRKQQFGGRLIAMCGDGTNDAPALAQADVGVAMQTGTQAAREAGNMVDLDSNPTKLIEIVEIGKQLLMTRGSLTTFSIANDVAKYFAILPALFLATYPELAGLNVMRLASPQSAILSAVIFNALIIIALIPLALNGVAYRPVGAAALLRRNLLIYGLGGLVLPFVGIKAIDLLVAALHLA